MIVFPTWLVAREDIGIDMKYWYMCLRMEAQMQNSNTFHVHSTQLLARYHIPSVLVENILTVLSNYGFLSYAQTGEQLYLVMMAQEEGLFTMGVHYAIACETLNHVINNHLELTGYDCREYEKWEHANPYHAVVVDLNEYTEGEQYTVKRYLDDPCQFVCPVELLLHHLSMIKPDVFPQGIYIISNL